MHECFDQPQEETAPSEQICFILPAVDSVKTSSRNQQLFSPPRLAECPSPGRVSFNCVDSAEGGVGSYGDLLWESKGSPQQSWAAQEVRLHFQNKCGNETDVSSISVPGVGVLFWKAWLNVVVCSCLTGLCGDWCSNDRAACGDWKTVSDWAFGPKVSSGSSLLSDFSNSFSAAPVRIAADLKH